MRPTGTGYDFLPVIGQYWFDVVTALEVFELESREQTWTLRFDDIAVERGYAGASERIYRFEVKDFRLTTYYGGESPVVGELSFRALGDVPLDVPDRWGRVPMVVVDIHVLGWTHAPC